MLSRPALLTVVLSAAAVAGYLTYRTLDRGAGASAPAIGTQPEAAAPAEPQRELAATLPQFTLGNLAGDPQPITSWPGKPLIINFWATWCAPCLREIPMLKEFQTANSDIQVVGIAVDRRPAVETFAPTMDFNYPILIGQNDAWAAAAMFGVDFYALPFTVFTGADGSVLGVHTGELHAEHLTQLRSVLDALAGGRLDVTAARSRLAGRQ
jgi:thiol-disulfide isomerase/thioredoxin